MAKGTLSRDELALLLETAGRLSAESNQEKLVQTILETACQMTGSPDGSVLLYDEERNGLFFAAVQGENAHMLLETWGEKSNQRVPLHSKAGEAFTTGQITVGPKGPHFKGVDKQTGKPSQSILSFPLGVQGKNIGVLQVLNKTDSKGKLLQYGARDCALIEHLGRQAATAINNVQLINRLLAHMGLYSRKSVDDLIKRVNQPARRERLTLLFADMRGFTRLCEWLDARQTQKIVNDLLTMYADQVLVRGGIVNKFLGDAVFAIFRGKDAPKQAVRCAFGMVDRFASLRHRWGEACNENLGFLDIGIGIVTEFVTLGSVGNSSVRDFTAIGQPVNVAHAFEAAARNGKRILVDNSTWSAARDFVADSAGPTSFVLQKPGGKQGKEYLQYHLKRLKPEIPLKVFLSHSHHDADLANHITDQLKSHGIETWYSSHDILPGKNFIETVHAGLLKCDWVVVMVSKHSIVSDWVRAEIKTAFDDPRFQGRILPLQVDSSSSASIFHELSVLQSLQVSRKENLGQSIREILLPREQDLRAKNSLPKRRLAAV